MYFFSFCFLLISPPSLLSPIFFLPSPFWTSGFTRTLYLFYCLWLSDVYLCSFLSIFLTAEFLAGVQNVLWTGIFYVSFCNGIHEGRELLLGISSRLILNVLAGHVSRLMLIPLGLR